MIKISSDEEIYITQNVFSCSELRPNIDILDKILFEEREIQQPDNELQLVSLLDGEKTKRIVVVSGAELETGNDDRIPEGTRHITNWAEKEWAEIRNRDGGSSNDLHGFVEQDILSLQYSELNYWLAKFVEVKKKQPCVEVYPPNTLYQLCCGIQRHFRENGRPEIYLSEKTYGNHRVF